MKTASGPCGSPGAMSVNRAPLFPFGYGLSYTTFKFESLRVDPPQLGTGATAKVSVDVANTGTREGDEVAQLYIHQCVASVTRPVMELRGFKRVTLKPGEKTTVEFTLTPDALSMIDVDMHRVVEPGMFDIMVGPSSVATSIPAVKLLWIRTFSRDPITADRHVHDAVVSIRRVDHVSTPQHQVEGHHLSVVWTP